VHYDVQPPPPIHLYLKPPTFQQHVVSDNAVFAVSILVAQACYQTADPSTSMLPLQNIHIFLYLSKLVILTSRLQLGGLSKVLSIIYPYTHKFEKQWAPLFCTFSSFCSRILNVLISNSLVSILPIPHPETLPDTPLRNIMEHTLMMKKFNLAETKDPKW
jgi:hypothetical protein